MRTLTVRGPRGPRGPAGPPGVDGGGARQTAVFYGNGSTATFTLPAAIEVGAEAAVTVCRNGLTIVPVENPTLRNSWDNYWVSGDQLIFGVAPRDGNTIHVTMPA
jgi:hypothetical protein